MSRWKSHTALFSLQLNVHPLRWAPQSMQCRVFFSGTCRNCYIIFYLQERSQGNQLPIVLWSTSQLRLLSFLHLCHAALCQTELLFSLNNLIFLFLFLSLSFLSLALYPSVTNAYPLEGFSLHHLTTLSVFKSKRGIRENHKLTLALTSIQMKFSTMKWYNFWGFFSA